MATLDGNDSVDRAQTGAEPDRGAEFDMASRITAAVARDDRQRHSFTMRVLLVVAAVEILALSVPDLLGLGGEMSDVEAHAARHLGSFAAAYGVGLLVVASRPARARTMLPVALVVAGSLLLTAIVDIARGQIPLFDEALHIPEVLSVFVVWRLTIPRRQRRSPGAATGPAPVTSSRPVRPSLSIVDDRRSTERD